MTKYVSLFNTRVLLADAVELWLRVTRLVSNSFDAWMLGLWQAQTQKEGNLTAVPSTESTLLLESTIMDKSVDTLEQNKRFLSASFRNFEKHLFC